MRDEAGPGEDDQYEDLTCLQPKLYEGDAVVVYAVRKLVLGGSPLCVCGACGSQWRPINQRDTDCECGAVAEKPLR